jgi:glycosyltransferase involved in cell wall biosynthesis
MKLISVITPTWNRATFLKKVYRSLLSQSYNKFEWIVCDDNSADNTLEVLKKFKNEKRIKMRIYSFSKRVGKNTMDNFAIKKAKGKFIYIADSDDKFSSNFFSDMIFEWKKIPNNLKKKIFAIISPCYSKKYNFKKFNLSSKLISSYELWYRLSKLQESSLFFNADILKKYKHKEIDYYVPEGVLWNKIGLKYKLWIVDNFYRHFYIGTSNSISHSDKINYIYGQHYALLDGLNYYKKINYINFRYFINSCTNLNRYNFHLNKSFFQQLLSIKSLLVKTIYSLTYLLGLVIYIRDKFTKKVVVVKYDNQRIKPNIK